MSERHPNGSETQEGPDWWLASDNRWYPPELHPEFRNARSVVLGDSGSAGADSAQSASSPSLLAGPDVEVIPDTDTEANAHAEDVGTTEPALASTTDDTVPGLLGVSPDNYAADLDAAGSEPAEPEPAEPEAAEPDVDADVSGAASDVTNAEPDLAEAGESPADLAATTPAGAERPQISIGAPLPESTTEEPPSHDESSAVVNPWTLPVRGRFDSEAVTTADPDRGDGSSSTPRIVLPGQLETDPAPQSIRPSGPTPVAKSLTFRPAEPTTVQAAVSVPTADETPWYQRSVDGSEPISTTSGQNTPNIYGGALSVAGGALGIVGALMTWATETGPLLDGFLWARKVPGFASNGGWVLVCGLLMGVAGVLSIIGIKPTGVWSIMSLVSGGLVLAAVLYSYADIVGAASEDWRTFVSASTGIDAVTLKARGVGLRPAFGLWLSAFAGLLGCAAGIYFKRDF